MISTPIKVLLIEDNPGDARLIQEWLVQDYSPRFDLVKLNCLEDGLACLSKNDIDVVLLDLSLPDSTGLDTLRKVHEHVPELPIVVLSGLDDEDVTLQAVGAGAQDYLVKDEINENVLPRVLQYAIERQTVQSQLARQSFIDDLTGLYNRRGFYSLAEQQLSLAKRNGDVLHLFFLDVDYLKRVNDTLGHETGNELLRDASNVLKKTFRSTDIIARLGGDEFVVLGIGFNDTGMESMLNRLVENLNMVNVGRPEAPYSLSISIGAAKWTPDDPVSIEELIVKADVLMYEQKRKKRLQAVL